MADSKQHKASAAEPRKATGHAADPSADVEKSKHAEREEELLDFWQRERIFYKTLEATEGNEEFVFYDGPPFATGLPHYGHLLASTLKDVVPRFRTMQGYHVPRRWGWDCHGLPAENEIEKELNLSTRKDIEQYGIANFNEKAREAVQRYADEWRQIIPRIGRFVDMDNDYRTMDPEYTESVWWSFSKLYANDLAYKGFKSMHICPRCETTLSNFEVSQGYADVTDISVTVKFEIRNAKSEIKSKLQIPNDKSVYLLAWTTTPWTLPGNVALAVGSSIKYHVLRIKNENDYVILAKDAVEKIVENTEYEVVQEISGSELVGLEYEPLLDSYKDAELENRENAWHIYAADFVTTDEGTGIVHIAPAFGADDLNMASDKELPMIQHVQKDGTIKDEVEPFAGMQAKPKDDPTATDVEIIKWLAHQSKLFAKEKVTHSYPHCWRCDWPLLNYAAESWFVKVPAFRDQMIENNKDVNWVPEDIGRARFHNLLEEAPDWAISRSRYWGAPLPVWVSDEGDQTEVLPSRDALHQRAPDKLAKTLFIRHGESDKNVAGVYDSTKDSYGLTNTGESQAREVATKLKEEGVDVIYTSPVRRARETAEIIADELGCELREAEGLWEVDSGTWDGKKEDGDEIADSKQAYYDLPPEEHYTAKRGETGESWEDVEQRSAGFVSQAVEENPGKTILFVSHQSTTAFALRPFKGWSIESTLETHLWDETIIAHCRPTTLYIDRMRGLEFDFHRPYIDAFTYEKDGQTYRRIEDVFDCWYESGSMPYAVGHYPFQADRSDPPNRVGFPADYIAEGLDQTRGWFYSMMALSTALFEETPYKNVIANGTFLTEEGQKMSKSKKNYPDPMNVVAKYGADALRYYMLSAPVVRAEDRNFEEKGVDEVAKKVIGRLKNVVSFYEQYTQNDTDVRFTIQDLRDGHVLDNWIIDRLHQMIATVTDKLESYELDRATRPLGDFVDDLSVWYLRQSRGRIKAGDDDSKRALATTQYVLTEWGKAAAPFMPFIADDIYLRVNNEKESVHLETWPEGGEVDQEMLVQMQWVRDVISQALEVRSNQGIKVRQPLPALRIKYQVSSIKQNEQLLSIIRDEVNVKEVTFDDGEEGGVELDTELTDELKREGAVRELLRAVQDERKNTGLQPGEEATLTVSTDEAGQELINEWESEIKQKASLSEIVFSDVSNGKEAGEHGFSFAVDVTK